MKFIPWDMDVAWLFSCCTDCLALLARQRLTWFLYGVVKVLQKVRKIKGGI